MSSDGFIPTENNLIMGGRIHHKNHLHSSRQMHGAGAALPKLMQNLKLFDGSVVAQKGGSINNKPNLRKPIKFII